MRSMEASWSVCIMLVLALVGGKEMDMHLINGKYKIDMVKVLINQATLEEWEPLNQQRNTELAKIVACQKALITQATIEEWEPYVNVDLVNEVLVHSGCLVMETLSAPVEKCPPVDPGHEGIHDGDNQKEEHVEIMIDMSPLSTPHDEDHTVDLAVAVHKKMEMEKGKCAAPVDPGHEGTHDEDPTVDLVNEVVLPVAVREKMETGDHKNNKEDKHGNHKDNKEDKHGNHKDNNQENLEEIIKSNQIGILSGPSVKFRPLGCDKVLVKFVYTTAALECFWSSSRREPISEEWETGNNKTKTESGMENIGYWIPKNVYNC